MKTRLDVAMFERGLCESREKAKALVMSGIVFVNDQKVDKAGTAVKSKDYIEIKGQPLRYVSRGGLKLEKAIEVFSLNTENKIAIDVGASSGGFTDCLLQNDVAKVYAVDVGYGQLAYKLRCDDRVIVFEKTNFRHMPFEEIGEKLDIAVMDVSFISITKLVENLRIFLKDEAECVFLIKPQFEADRSMVSKNGVITDKKLHEKIVYSTITALQEKGYYLKALDFSPIKGPKGNIEFISYYSLNEKDMMDNLADYVHSCILKAHEEL